ncbi:ribosome-associated translation inhibitor RaiA [Desulfovibrio aminophilus]|nr:ribosome-associated translation inhibitor RaiA [Desulfovibrio aminophilus]MCM0754285.1 ribosome-associated translation inhibitor RaiA [Desulfovibrio aminophilus]
MNIAFNFKNFDPSEHLKEYAESRFEKLSKFIADAEDPELQVNLSVEKFRHKAEVVFLADNLHLSAYEESEDMYSTIDMVLDKLEAQLRRMREKMKDRRRSGRDRAVSMGVLTFIEESGKRTPSIAEMDKYEPKPMSVDEAAMQLESRSYDFLVFRNSETDGLNVIYRRKNGDFGLIDPGF